MATATVSPNSPSEQRTAGERVFRNLFQARDEVCQGVARMERLLLALKGDLSAMQGLGQALTEDHGDESEVIGLMHCAERALDTLAELHGLTDRVHDAAVVVRGNDATRLSRDALRYEPGPHKADYSSGIHADPEEDDTAAG
jgi:hypothetical protein